MVCSRIRVRFTSALAALAVAVPVLLLSAPPTAAHCFIGARFLPATIASEDPCVADELSLPTYSMIRTPATADEPSTRETEISFEYAKSITPDLGVSVGRRYLILKPDGLPTQRGWDNWAAAVKYQLFTVPRHEFIVSLGIDVDIGGTGSKSIGAESFSTITPAIYFGKGFGDLPDSLALLKPFAVTGVIGYGIPSRASTPTDTGDVKLNPHTLNTAFSLQYSLPYLQANVRDTGNGAVFNHLIPLVEISLVTPLDRGERGRTTGTVNPGFIWSDKYYQIGVEAIIPVNGRTGHQVGFLAQLHWYLDDIFPNTLGKPLFGTRR
jgi:hypothetical protein